MTDRRPIRVIFVCTHNSARSVMAEALLRREAASLALPVQVESAGTHPGRVNPLTLRALREAGLPDGGYRSKSVTEFLEQSFDYVITVCDHAQETCPVFPGGRRTLHWSNPDPSAVMGSDEERLQAFRDVRDGLAARIRDFAAGVAAEAAGHPYTPVAADPADDPSGRRDAHAAPV